MMLIKCGGCEVVHESTLPACPVCSRCPCCGETRVSKRELAEQADCATCGVPYCSGCGRCHVCNKLRFSGMEAHSCGFPDDPEQVRRVEETFGLKTSGAGG